MLLANKFSFNSIVKQSKMTLLNHLASQNLSSTTLEMLERNGVSVPQHVVQENLDMNPIEMKTFDNESASSNSQK